MPVSITYPGVYIEELASGQHPIAPVPTSIAAFIGRAPIGTLDEPVTIFSFGDFTHSFGGLAPDYPMSYAVQHFFQNGGSEAVIVRLYEALAAESDGFARLAFRSARPLLPEGWQLAKVANNGDTLLHVSGPAGGAPVLGMQLTLDNDASQIYTVLGFFPADPSRGVPPSVLISPPLGSHAGQVGVPLHLSYGPAPAARNVRTATSNQITLHQGTGIPGPGDTFTVGGDSNTYTITGQPEVTISPVGAVVLQAPFSPEPAQLFPTGANVSIAEPLRSPLPLHWQIDAMQPGQAGEPSTLSVVGGEGAPLPNDTFAVDSKPGAYLVTGFTPATPEAPASIRFLPLSGTLPLDPAAFLSGSPLAFVRPAPLGYGIATGPDAGGTQFTLSTNNGAAKGVVDVGDTFTVNGDQTVYTVRRVDRSTNTVAFLPVAGSTFRNSTAVRFTSPLVLRAESQGVWGNSLVAEVDRIGITKQSAATFNQYELTADDLFHLRLHLLDTQGRVIRSESYANVTVKATGAAAGGPNRLDRVLTHQSLLARVDILPEYPPPSGSASNDGGGNDGDYLSPLTYIGDPGPKTGLFMLEKAAQFNLLCIPPDRRISPDVPVSKQDLEAAVRHAAARYAADRRAIYIVDPLAIWAQQVKQGNINDISPASLGITGANAAGIQIARNAAVYFPRIIAEDLLNGDQRAVFAPCGAIAGVIAARDVSRGVWKAPAGRDAGVSGIVQLELDLDDSQNGLLNAMGINCLRNFPVIGPVVWGARTLRGADQFQDDYKYLPVRRLALFLEASIEQATRWAVFEPNSEALWSSLRLTVESFLAGLSRQGAFYDYAVRCDATTTTQSDIDNGFVNVLISFAPVRPAEFVIIRIQQMAGRS